MKILNKTRNTVIAEDVSVADTPLQRAKGLLGRKEFKKGQALIIRPCNSVHTFFMRFPIDILFVGKDQKVLKSISSLRPGRLSPIYFHAAFVLELPEETISASMTSPGDLLSIE